MDTWTTTLFTARKPGVPEAGPQDRTLARVSRAAQEIMEKRPEVMFAAFTNPAGLTVWTVDRSGRQQNLTYLYPDAKRLLDVAPAGERDTAKTRRVARRMPLSEIRPGDEIVGFGGFRYFVMWTGEIAGAHGSYATPGVIDYLGGVGPLGPFTWDAEFEVLRSPA